MKPRTLLAVFSLLVIFPAVACSGNLTLTTYYPAPFGAYKSLRLYPQADLADPCQVGSLYVDSNNAPRFCEDLDGDGTGSWGYAGSWAQDVDGGGAPVIYPRDASANLFVGIGTSAPGMKLSLDQDGGILAIGAFGAGILLPAQAEGAGTRMLWYPRQAAFRAGEVDGTQWDDAQIGQHSFAANFNTVATGDYSAALGLGTVAQAYGSTAVGQYNTIMGTPDAWVATDPVFAVGTGTDAVNRATALAVLKDGTVGIGAPAVDNPYLVHFHSGGLLVETTDAEPYLTLRGAADFGMLGDAGYLFTGGATPALGLASATIQMGASAAAATMTVDGAQQRVGIKQPAPSVELEVNGTVMATAFLYASDENLKEGVEPISSSLEKIQQIHGVRFHWREGGEEDIGVIAQEVEGVFPELVETNPLSGLKSVKYGNLIAPLIEALKEQQREIEWLRQRIEALEAAEGAL